MRLFAPLGTLCLLLCSCSLLLDESGILATGAAGDGGSDAATPGPPIDASASTDAATPLDAAPTCVPGPRRFCDDFDAVTWSPLGAGWETSCNGGASTVRDTTRVFRGAGALLTEVPNNASAEARCELVRRIPGPWAKTHVRARVYIEKSALTAEFTMLLRAGFRSGSGQPLVFVALTQTGVRLQLTEAPSSAAQLGPTFPTGTWVDVALDIDPESGARFTYGDATASLAWAPLTGDGTRDHVLFLGGSRFASGTQLTARYDDLDFSAE